MQADLGTVCRSFTEPVTSLSDSGSGSSQWDWFRWLSVKKMLKFRLWLNLSLWRHFNMKCNQFTVRLSAAALLPLVWPLIMEQMTDYWSVRNTQYTHTPSLYLSSLPLSLLVCTHMCLNFSHPPSISISLLPPCIYPSPTSSNFSIPIYLHLFLPPSYPLPVFTSPLILLPCLPSFAPYLPRSLLPPTYTHVLSLSSLPISLSSSYSFPSFLQSLCLFSSVLQFLNPSLFPFLHSIFPLYLPTFSPFLPLRLPPFISNSLTSFLSPFLPTIYLILTLSLKLSLSILKAQAADGLVMMQWVLPMCLYYYCVSLTFIFYLPRCAFCSVSMLSSLYPYPQTSHGK